MEVVDLYSGASCTESLSNPLTFSSLKKTSICLHHFHPKATLGVRWWTSVSELLLGVCSPDLILSSPNKKSSLRVPPRPPLCSNGQKETPPETHQFPGANHPASISRRPLPSIQVFPWYMRLRGGLQPSSATVPPSIAGEAVPSIQSAVSSACFPSPWSRAA